MNRFGSSRLRIVWVLLSLLLTGLVLGAIQGFGEDGNSLQVFGATIPLGMDARPYASNNLGRLIYTLVPAIILLGGILPLGEWLSGGAKGERFKALLLGTGLAFLHGLFLSQVALLPVFAACIKLFGSPFAQAAVQVVAEGEVAPIAPWRMIFQSDLNALVLGLQLLVWTSALGLLLKSNRGLAILGAYTLAELNKLVAWVAEFGGDMELPKFVVKGTTFLSHILPMQILPEEKFAWSALPLGLGVPLALAALLLLLPAKAPKAPKKAKA
jgi:hypothetical protein